MLKNITIPLVLSFSVVISGYAYVSTTTKHLDTSDTHALLDKYGAGFTNIEHKNIADLIFLQYPQPNHSKLITMPNGFQATYGEIMAYGGDMFGNSSYPISNCEDQTKAQCFQKQFAAIASKDVIRKNNCANPRLQTANLNNYISLLEIKLNEARQAGIEDGEFYAQHEAEITRNLNKLTCGGSFLSDYIPFGNYIKLAETNFDHFLPDALTAYQTGHRSALENAQKGFVKVHEGRMEEALKLLELAYAENAFASHYLSDAFASGHIRVPRRAIDTEVLLPPVLKLILTNIMHAEDNKYGLNVVNARGDQFKVYGDDYLFVPEAATQRAIMVQALQYSADAIYDTFITGNVPSNYPELDLVPLLSRLDEFAQSSPLFKVENGQLLKRTSNHDVNDYHWTIYWSAIVTLMEFKL